jgi:transcriptional regulator with XRE-family HTH domain
MSTTSDLVTAIKKELKALGMTYADLAQALGMAESSVKRMLAKGDMSLARVDDICRAMKLDFAELARRVADTQHLLQQLRPEQERAVVADKQLLLVAICVLSQWTLEQMTGAYRLSEAEAVKALVQLDRIGIIELRPLNRYRLKLAKTFRWLPHGPVMTYFREHALLDYFGGGFDGEAEGLMLVHGSVSRAVAPAFMDRLQRVAQDFAQQHQADQKLADKDREGYTASHALGGVLHKHGEHTGVTVEPVVGNFARGKKTHQRHITQRAFDDLQLGAGSAKMWPTPARATDVNGPGDAPRGGAGGVARRAAQPGLGVFGLQRFPQFGAHTHQVGAGR